MGVPQTLHVNNYHIMCYKLTTCCTFHKLGKIVITIPLLAQGDPSIPLYPSIPIPHVINLCPHVLYTDQVD